jgi:hypothetical protein
LLGTAVLFLVAAVVAGLTLRPSSEPLHHQPHQGKDPIMTLVRQHTYTLDPADLAEHLARRAKAIDAIRVDHPGLVRTQLTRLTDGTFTDAWHWDTAEHMGAAFAAAPGIPEIGPAMALMRDHSAENGEVVDER